MRDKLSELIQSAVGGCAKYWADVIADKLIAEGVIVPPCKVGDTIYFVSRGEIIPMVVNSISLDGNDLYFLNCNYADEEQYDYRIWTFTDKARGYMFGLTREEAEKALAERSEGK